jgi:hypothetical protein
MSHKEEKIIYYMEKKVPQQGQQGDVGGREGGRQTIRSLDDREISVVVA